VLAVEITRAGFEWALTHSGLSHFDRDLYADREAWAQRVRMTPVRVQGDPERSLRLAPLPYRSLQLGLSGEAAERYADEWITGLTDVTPLVHAVRDLVRAGDEAAATARLPVERPYPLPPEIAAIVGASADGKQRRD
jgi:hypothetical protein